MQHLWPLVDAMTAGVTGVICGAILQSVRTLGRTIDTLVTDVAVIKEHQRTTDGRIDEITRRVPTRPRWQS